MVKIITVILRVFQFILAAFMMYAGIATALFVPTGNHHDKFGWIYDSRISLVILGVIFFCSGATLFVGKFFKKKHIVGYGLMAIYLCFLFAGLLDWVALGFGAALTNLVASCIVGFLYLRWKHNFLYDPPLKD